jgi:hypothetical protein
VRNYVLYFVFYVFFRRIGTNDFGQPFDPEIVYLFGETKQEGQDLMDRFRNNTTATVLDAAFFSKVYVPLNKENLRDVIGQSRDNINFYWVNASPRSYWSHGH